MACNQWDKMADFPKTYAIPRNGEVVSVGVRDRDEARAVRSELELLRRIGRFLKPLRTLGTARIPGKYCRSEIDELSGIAADANDPTLQASIDRMDRELPNVRKDIMMAVLNDEAEKLADEIVESGVTDGGDAPCDTQQEPSAENAPPTDASAEGEQATDALEQAEAELARTVGAEAGESDAVEEVSVPADASASELAEELPNEERIEDPDASAPPTESTSAATPDAEVATTNESSPATECADSSGTEPAADAPDCDGGESASDGLAGAADGQSAEVDTSAQSPSTSESWTPGRAERAVEEIENGIRKLAGVLTTEVTEQWTDAKQALKEIQAIRDQLSQARESSREILDEIHRAKEKTAIARAEADIARREAGLFRDDAEKAKIRADKLAGAAEKSVTHAAP